MKKLRILGAIIGTVAMVGMFSCGGSSYLMEAPLETWDEEAVVVRFHASALDSTSTSGQTGLAKAFFSDGDFSGSGTFDGEGLFQYLEVDCKFDAPVAAAIDGGQPGPAAVTFADTDPSLCPDPRICCVYTTDADYTDPCAITVECILDPDAANLANTQLDLAFHLRQYMQTNMRSNSGVIITALLENGDPGGTPDSDIFDVSTAVIHRTTDGADCDGISDSLAVNSDNPWLGLPVENGPDILNNSNALWNVDTIGAVDVVGDYADCTMYYKNILGNVSLAPVSSGGSVAKDTLITGTGRICNSTSHTDCEGDGTIDFGWALDMFDGDPYGQLDMTFADAGISHFCGTSEGFLCHPTATGVSQCVSYLMPGESAPGGCQRLCMDQTGLWDSSSSVPENTIENPDASKISQLTRQIYDDADPTTACADSDGTEVLDYVRGFYGTIERICIPNQQFACDSSDGDGIDDANDTCPSTYNPRQTDSERDNQVAGSYHLNGQCVPAGFLKENASGFPVPAPDGYGDACDNCPTIINPTQDISVCNYDIGYTGGSGKSLWHVTLVETEVGAVQNYAPDGISQFIGYANRDNCPCVYNPSQTDSDGDGIGDACQNDWDGDTKPDGADNCYYIHNFDQLDTDGDTAGDACDADDDDDLVDDVEDNCPLVANGAAEDNQANSETIESGNRDDCGDACDDDDVNFGGCNTPYDSDSDGIFDEDDNCPTTVNPGPSGDRYNQANADDDRCGDACDTSPSDPQLPIECAWDEDLDGVADEYDNCINVANPTQDNVDLDPCGAACDTDDNVFSKDCLL